MKNILYFLLACVVFVTMSCRDESLSPFPETKTGAFVQIEELVTPVFDLNSLETSAFEFRVNDEMGNVASYDVSVSWNQADTVHIKTVTEFPSVVSIRATEIAAAYGVTVEEFKAGDRFDFVASTTGKDGSTYGISDITAELLGNPGQQQGYRFISFVSCPYEADAIEGSYRVTKDDFGVTKKSEVEVVAGPGENQFTILDGFGHGLDFIVDINPQTGQTTVTKQETWVPQSYGLPERYGKGYAASSNGFAFSCAGIITLNFSFSVDIGSYGGVWNYTIEKL